MQVIERQTVIINQSLVGIKTFYTSFDLNFTPDKVIIRDVTYVDCDELGGGNCLHYITCPWVNSKDGVLLSFINSVTDTYYQSNPQAEYKINGNINNGDSTFYLHKIHDDGVVESDADGILSFTLEFQRVQEERNFNDVILTNMHNMMQMMMKLDNETYPFQLPSSAELPSRPCRPSFVGGRDPTDNVNPVPNIHRDLEPAEVVTPLQPTLPSKAELPSRPIQLDAKGKPIKEIKTIV